MLQAAVLTGDLVASTGTDSASVDKAIGVLNDAARDFQKIGNLSQPIAFTRYRGDGWQVALHRAGLCYRLAAYLIARLRASDVGLATRIGIGIGSIDSLGNGDLAAAHGPAFIESGKALESLRNSSGIAVRPFTRDNGQIHSHIWLEAAFTWLVHTSQRWSREQAEAIAFQVTRGRFEDSIPTTLKDGARLLSISRQALSARLEAAGAAPIMANVRAAEDTLDDDDVPSADEEGDAP